METVSNVKITNWKADPSYLEVGIWIEPWNRSAWYRREFTSVSASYVSKWIWLDGQKESGQKSHTNEDTEQVLDKLVRDHETLGLFYEKYGIGAEE